MSDEEKGLLRPQGKTRSALSQVLLLGAICFCVPGMWNSITSMAGGIEDQAVVSTATAWLYGCFAVTSILAPVANNKLGSRATLFLGTLGYLIYVVSLWCALCPDMLPRMHSINSACNAVQDIREDRRHLRRGGWSGQRRLRSAAVDGPGHADHVLPFEGHEGNLPLVLLDHLQHRRGML